MNTKTWIIFGVICVAFLGGLVAFSRSQKPAADTSGVDVNGIIAASDANGNIADHVEGSSTSPVRLIEYGDFQCPSCGGAHPGIKKITEDYGDKIGFVFRNFPLTQAHPNAVAASTAAEAAGLQGKYWQMHNIIFETQTEWSTLSAEQRTAKFTTLATQVGVTDTEKFKTDLSSKSITKKISFDQSLGRSVKVGGTPTFFLNGEELDQNATNSIVRGDAEPLRKILNAKLKEKGIEAPASN